MGDRGAPQSFGFTAGETVEIDFVADGDIDGAVARFWAARSPGEVPVLTTEGVAPTAIATVGASPNFTLLISDENTESLLGTYAYEVELEDVSGNKTKAAHGYLSFERQVQQ